MPTLKEQVAELRALMEALEKRIKRLEDNQRPIGPIGPIPKPFDFPSPIPVAPLRPYGYCPGCGKFVNLPAHRCITW